MHWMFPIGTLRPARSSRTPIRSYAKLDKNKLQQYKMTGSGQDVTEATTGSGQDVTEATTISFGKFPIKPSDSGIVRPPNLDDILELEKEDSELSDNPGDGGTSGVTPTPRLQRLRNKLRPLKFLRRRRIGLREGPKSIRS